MLADKFGRVIRDLRISITDRCNFRCGYCMPDGFVPKAQRDILSFEEIERLVRLFVSLGVEKVRVTGGEPLLRRNVLQLLQMLRAIPGVRDLAMTSNGWFLGQHVEALRAAGVDRLNLSMDSLDREKFKRLTGVDALERVLSSMEAATAVGFFPLKINCVVMRGENDDEVADFAAFARRTGHTVRFIEFMPLDSAKAWSRDRMVGGREILARIEERYALEPMDARSKAETARRYRFKDGAPGEIGLIAPVTMPFCGQCNRLRVTTDGKIRNCLFSLYEHDLMTPLRDGASNDELASVIRACVAEKEAGHKINQPDFEQPARTMSCIGG
jgi:cyclic pyranopterin phosphate synthase